MSTPCGACYYICVVQCLHKYVFTPTLCKGEVLATCVLGARSRDEPPAGATPRRALLVPLKASGPTSFYLAGKNLPNIRREEHPHPHTRLLYCIRMLSEQVARAFTESTLRTMINCHQLCMNEQGYCSTFDFCGTNKGFIRRQC